MSGWRIVNVMVAGTEVASEPSFAERTLLVFPASGEGEALAGAFAALHGDYLLGRLSAFAIEDDKLVATRMAYGGRISLQVRLARGIAVATMREPCAGTETISLGRPSSVPVARSPLAGNRIGLEGAHIVVSGGRGLDETGFALLDRIAAQVDGAVGASLPAIDLGLASVSRQIGQSGKFVTPALYLAVGLSGTPQHLAGIGSATRIVAINADRDAPIFRFAELGVVADARTLLPELTAALGRRVST
ncbi:electron transfer flavoprotein subunit alpha/FixB family protein [Sphingomonas sp. CL5.1]|uniref:electron transfer flavoprotein subunit alpha/FixB family protein n=1 Tax=Sphingomonas sp. CL5.1 TaxID=2653203 RepID=UPI001583F6B1|nr:electron transfer flavoprotein subunit alpha/FixB family protein [Sphingomonas sp. CL5.1]QKS01153.1 electron transfer flavoprotein subunit alpha/FixB family protein [Sphingomonas sp. CL5.1]